MVIIAPSPISIWWTVSNRRDLPRLRLGSQKCQKLLLQSARKPRSLFPTSVPTRKPSDALATGTCAENKELVGFVSYFFTILIVGCAGRSLPAHCGPRPIPSRERARRHPAARYTRYRLGEGVLRRSSKAW